MPLSFPASPTVGQQSTQNGRTYAWTGSAWELVAASGGSGLSWSSVPVSASATGTAGSIAYDSSGRMYLCVAANTWVRSSFDTTWATFAPSTVSGLAGWFDASDASTIYDSSSGGSLVVANGSVARWLDKSGSGNHAIQATSGSRPTRRTAGLNNKPSIQFVADTGDSGDWLGIAHASALNGSSGLAVFAVYKTSATGTNIGMAGKWQGVNESGGTAWVFGYLQNSAVSNTAMHITNDGTSSSTLVGTSSFNDGSPRLLGLVSTSAGLQTRMNGVPEGTNSSAVLSNANSTSGVVIGGYVGYTESSGQRLMSCHISELLIYNASLTSQNVTDIESYLMTKWGVA